MIGSAVLVANINGSEATEVERIKCAAADPGSN